MSDDWKPVRSDGLYAPTAAQEWESLEKLVRAKLDHIVVEGKTHVWIVSRYMPMESVGVELLRMILRAKAVRKDDWKPSRIPVPEHEQDKHADTQLIAALEAELLDAKKELAVLKSGKPERGVYVAWEGSPFDLATEIEPLLTVDQLQELACELVVKWRERRMATGGGFGGASIPTRVIPATVPNVDAADAEPLVVGRSYFLCCSERNDTGVFEWFASHRPPSPEATLYGSRRGTVGTCHSHGLARVVDVNGKDATIEHVSEEQLPDVMPVVVQYWKERAT